MPTPSAVNTANARQPASPIAYPSAAPMNGAVQGEATSTASTPEPNQSRAGFAERQRAARSGKNVPTSNTPERLSASAKKNSASTATATGDCSWKPQPSSPPSARAARRTPASSQNDAITPAA